MKIISFLFFALILPTQITAQVTQEWVRIYNTPGNAADISGSVATDAAGNIYVAGYSGSSADNSEYNLIKYNPDGEIIWVRSYNFANFPNRCYAVIVDNEGDIYVTGESYSTSQNANIATVKYDSSGTQLWVQRFGDPTTNESANKLAVDGNNNVYVGGYIFQNKIVIKYNSSGVQQWTLPINYTEMTVDNIGNVYLVGYEAGFAKVWKYNTNGSLQWSKNPLGTLGSSYGGGVKVDSEGNVFVVMNQVGNYVTVKYNSNGIEQWVQSYQSQTQSPYFNIALDQDGNCFVSGEDNTNIANNSSDITTIKYRADGNQLWIRTYNGPTNGYEVQKKILTDNDGNVYVYLESYNASTKEDIVLIKYSPEGDTLWMQTYSTPGEEYPFSFTIDNNYNIYATGSIPDPIQLMDRILIKYSQPTAPKITKPSANERLIAGEKNVIMWSGGKLGEVVQLDYKVSGDTSFHLIDIAIPAAVGYYEWNVPDSIISTKAQIKITVMNDTTLYSISDTFKVKPYILTKYNSLGDYEVYGVFDPYLFGNDTTSLWPASWWQNFDYSGTDPFTGFSYLLGGAAYFLLTESSDFSDWVSWVNTFGINACYHRTSFPPIYSYSAVIRWYANAEEWGGSCFGISTSNALYFKERDALRAKYPSLPDNSPLYVTSDIARPVINELFTHQNGKEHQDYRQNVGLSKTPNQTLNDIKKMLIDDEPVRTLSMNSNDPQDPGGHSILAYKVKKDENLPNIYYVYIYDNSYPLLSLDFTFIEIDTAANNGNGRWTTSYGWQNWGGKTGLFLREPAINYLINPTLGKQQNTNSPFILGDRELKIVNKNKTPILITDQFGNKSGFFNNALLTEIPNSYPNIIDNGKSGPPIGYDLSNSNYSILLNGFSDTTVTIGLFTGNKSFMYERSGAEQTQTDRLFFDGGVSATNPDAQTKIIKLLNLLNENTQEKLAVVRSIELAQNDSVKIENPDSNKVKIISYGTAKNYEIELNYATENGVGRFVDFEVLLTANTSHTFVPEWTDLTNTNLMVLVDNGNNGTIDDTLYLQNQVTGIGDDQGSLLRPDSYNLAQNYPNPFNPSTTISWQSPVGSNQTLKIYDVLGNEVATLVDEFRSAGRYEVSFDAAQLSSGIYFYRLQAGDFVETKKMILIK